MGWRFSGLISRHHTTVSLIPANTEDNLQGYFYSLLYLFMASMLGTSVDNQDLSPGRHCLTSYPLIAFMTRT